MELWALGHVYLLPLYLEMSDSFVICQSYGLEVHKIQKTTGLYH